MTKRGAPGKNTDRGPAAETGFSPGTIGASLEKSAGELDVALDRFIETRSAILGAVLDSTAASLRAGGKVLAFGNGGSAAEAQHFAAELVNGFLDRARRPISALALTTDASCLTAVANDRSFAEVFSRQIEALGRPGDVAIALTTSGTSPNVVLGLKTARARGMVTIALTGQAGGDAASHADYVLDVPSCSVPRIQEAHLVLLHVLAEGLEKALA